MLKELNSTYITLTLIVFIVICLLVFVIYHRNYIEMLANRFQKVIPKIIFSLKGLSSKIEISLIIFLWPTKFLILLKHII